MTIHCCRSPAIFVTPQDKYMDHSMIDMINMIDVIDMVDMADYVLLGERMNWGG